LATQKTEYGVVEVRLSGVPAPCRGDALSSKQIQGGKMFENGEMKSDGSGRAKWLAWLAAVGSWVASIIFMVMAKDTSFPGMPDWVMYLVWFVSQAAELLLVIAFVVLLKYLWSMAFDDELKRRQTSFMTGRLLVICLFSIILGFAPCWFDFWSTNVVLQSWVNQDIGAAVVFAKWLALFVVLGSELALSMNDDMQMVYQRLGVVESGMSLVGDENPDRTITLPEGVSRREAYQRISEVHEEPQAEAPEPCVEGA